MAKVKKTTCRIGHDPKKTSVDKGKCTKCGNKVGGDDGSTTSKCYKKNIGARESE
tara:strand:- start:712 stop:876 length:165 start_codon:yes stop_codon:yes gene_type:complete